MTDFKSLYETARRVGENHARYAIKYANENRLLRGVIWRALMQLRAGHPGLARDTLEQQIKKDQHKED